MAVQCSYNIHVLNSAQQCNKLHTNQSAGMMQSPQHSNDNLFIVNQHSHCVRITPSIFARLFYVAIYNY